MADKLSGKELEALLKVAQPSKTRSITPKQQSATPQPFNFKNSKRLTKDQSRTLETLHESYARTLAATLATTMRVVVDVDLAFIDQTSYKEFILSLANPCSAYRFTMTPPARSALISIAPQLLLTIIDRALGGPGTGLAIPDRPLTPIETNITKKLILRLFNNLESAWERFAPFRVSEIQQITNPDFLDIAVADENMVIIGLEAHSNQTSGLVHICYPLIVLEQLMPKLSSNLAPQRPPRPHTQQLRLNKIDIPAIIQLARGTLSLAELAKLESGDVIRLDTSKDDPAVVFLDTRPKFLARPGLAGSKRAVQIIESLDENAEEDYL